MPLITQAAFGGDAPDEDQAIELIRRSSERARSPSVGVLIRGRLETELDITHPTTHALLVTLC
jgi:hypothetical protein